MSLLLRRPTIVRTLGPLCACLLLAVSTAGAAPPLPYGATAGAAPPLLYGASEPDPLFDDDYDIELEAAYADPGEPVNRGIFVFNQQLNRWVLDPITRAYQWAVPAPARRAVRRVFANLGAPPTLANDILQLEWKDAGITLSRFVVNTTIGIGGLFDPAQAWMGLPPHESDFGQTLALAGVESGPYIVLPLFGPSTARDGAGQVVDTFFSPATYFFGLQLAEQLIYGGSQGFITGEKHYEEMKALEESSVDFYATLRSAFHQNRKAAVWDRREHRRQDWQEPF